MRHRDRELPGHQGGRPDRGVRGARGGALHLSVLVALERFDLRIPGCSSLKQKRHVLKSLTSALRSRFNVSVAEVDHHDLWQRTAIAVASTGGQTYHVRRVMQQVERFVEAWGEVEVIDRELTLHQADA